MRRIILVLLFAVLQTGTVDSFAQTLLRASQIGGGGGLGQSASTRLLGTIGQPLAGFSQNLRSGFWYVVASSVVSTGIEEDVSGADPDDETLPDQFRLHQNYPNPFNPSTTIAYDLPKPSSVRIEVYDGLGRLVRVLVHADLAAGVHQTVWDGRDSGGRTVSTGLYIYRLQASSFSRTRAMLLVK